MPPLPGLRDQKQERVKIIRNLPELAYDINTMKSSQNTMKIDAGSFQDTYHSKTPWETAKTDKNSIEIADQGALPRLPVHPADQVSLERELKHAANLTYQEK